jgi:hypothetical protein
MRPGSLPEREAMALGRDGNALDRSTASLLAKPTPINIDSGSDRFAMFNIVGTSPSSIA